MEYVTRYRSNFAAVEQPRGCETYPPGILRCGQHLTIEACRTPCEELGCQTSECLADVNELFVPALQLREAWPVEGARHGKPIL